MNLNPITIVLVDVNTLKVSTPEIGPLFFEREDFTTEKRWKYAVLETVKSLVLKA